MESLLWGGRERLVRSPVVRAHHLVFPKILVKDLFLLAEQFFDVTTQHVRVGKCANGACAATRSFCGGGDTHCSGGMGRECDNLPIVNPTTDQS